METGIFLLPLSKQEVMVLAAIIAATLSAIDTAKYTNEIEKTLALSQKPLLESIREKITKVR